MNPRLDKELEALSIVYEAIRDLSAAERMRIAWWINERNMSDARKQEPQPAEEGEA